MRKSTSLTQKGRVNRQNRVSVIFFKPFVLALALFLCMVGVGYAVTCDADLTAMPCNMTIPTIHSAVYSCPTDECFIINQSGNFNLNGSTFQTNDSDYDGGIIINASNVNMTCAGGIIIGNQTSRTIGINISNLNSNVTIRDCEINKYKYGIHVKGAGATSTAENNSIINNKFKNSFVGVYFQYAKKLDISGNTIYSCNNSRASIGIAGYGSVNSYSTINDNTILGNGTCEIGIILDSVMNWVNVTNNKVSNIDRGIVTQESKNTRIVSNTITNATYDFDFYMTGIMVLDVYTDGNPTINITILNNTIVKAGSLGILIQKGLNVSVINNSISLLTWAEKESRQYEVDDAGDPACGIGIMEVRKSDTAGGAESFSDGYGVISMMNATSVYVSGNTFDSSVECLMMAQGTNDLRHDLTDYWYASFRMPYNFIDKNEFFISNSVNTIKHYRPEYLYKADSVLYLAYVSNSDVKYRKINYTIDRYHQLHVNTNLTRTYNLSLYNLSTYNDVFNSTSITPQCSNQKECNVSLNATNRSIVLQYPTSTQPRVTGIATTISDLSYTLSGKTLSVDCTGTGNHSYTNLDYLGNRYDVYHNGVLITQSSSSNYTAIDCSTWDFISSESSSATTISNTFNAGLAVFGSGLILIILTVIFSAVIGIYQTKKENKPIDWDKLIKSSVLIIGIMIIVLLGLAIIGLMINTL